jgi:hypothetical protein
VALLLSVIYISHRLKIGTMMIGHAQIHFDEEEKKKSEVKKHADSSYKELLMWWLSSIKNK